MPDPKRPFKKYSLGNVQLAVWENHHEESTYYRFKVSRFYKEDEDWKNTDSLNGNDLAALGILAQRAANDLVVKERTKES